MLVSASTLQTFRLSLMASKPKSHRLLHVAGTALEEGASKRARTVSTDASSTSAIKDAFGKYTDYLNNLSWPKMFSSGLDMTISRMKGSGSKDDAFDGETIVDSTDFDAINMSAAAAFCVLLRHTFHVLFPAIMSMDAPNMLESSEIKQRMCEKWLKPSSVILQW